MMALVLAHVVVVGVLAVVLAQTLLNDRHVPDLGAMPPPPVWPRIAVLVPARNEAARITACVRAWTRQRYPDYEVVVYDDDSTDDTGTRAAAAGRRRARVLRGAGLPDGWRGKTHACHALRQAVGADVLVFADADVVPRRDALARTAGALATLGADAVSALPSHTSHSAAVRIVAALQNWAPLAFVPLWLRRARRSPAFAVVNGQFLAIRAAAYDACGGFEAVRATLAEDSLLGRRLVARGYRVALVNGARVLRSRPYDRFTELWRANVRNLATAFLGSPALLVVAVTALAVVDLGPLAALGAGLAGVAHGAAWTWLPLAETALALGSRAVADRRAGYPPWIAALSPLAVGALLAMAIDAALRARGRGAVEWRGRRYDVTRPAA